MWNTGLTGKRNVVIVSNSVVPWTFGCPTGSDKVCTMQMLRLGYLTPKQQAPTSGLSTAKPGEHVIILPRSAQSTGT